MSKLGELLKKIDLIEEADFSKFLGAVIVAVDGEFLGQISKNIYDKNSISNPYTFGSRYNKNSIFNSYGKYGSKYTDESPFNQYAKKPPQIISAGKPVAILSANPYFKTQLEIVNPDELLLWFNG